MGFFPLGVLRLMNKYLDDLLFILGAVLISIGTNTLCPAATWFVAGAFCISASVLVARSQSEVNK
jgi:hypothetical protein